MSTEREQLRERVESAGRELLRLAATLAGAGQDVAGNGHVASADEATGPLREAPTAPAPSPSAPRRWWLVVDAIGNAACGRTESGAHAFAGDDEVVPVVEASALEAAEHERRQAYVTLAHVEQECDALRAKLEAAERDLSLSLKTNAQVMKLNTDFRAKLVLAEAKIPHLHDLYDALGVKWGDDPFFAIRILRGNSASSPSSPRVVTREELNSAAETLTSVLDITPSVRVGVAAARAVCRAIGLQVEGGDDA